MDYTVFNLEKKESLTTYSVVKLTFRGDNEN